MAGPSVSLAQLVTGTVSISGTVTVTGALTDTQLRASAVPVSGAFFQATQPVSISGSVPVTGTFFQATQPVSIAATVAVSGTFFQTTQPISGTVTVGNASLAVTGTFFQATQPVSGTVTVGNASIAVTGTFFQATQPVSIAGTVAVSGTFFQATQPVSGTVTANAGTGTLTVGQATGTNLHTVVDSGTITTVSTVTAVTTVSTVTTVAAVTAITNALPAGTNTLGGALDVPDATATYASSNADSTALEASHVVKNAAGVLYGISGYNSKTSAQFIQVFNSTTVPADTTVPVVVFLVQAGSNFSYDTGRFGKSFATGIAVSNSSTAATKTVGAADTWFNPIFK